jgi:hypothetical protein
VIDPQFVATFLNTVLSADPEATRKLFTTRHACNEKLGDHPFVICGGEPLEVGALGVINGILLASGSSDRVAMTVDDEDGRIVKFMKARFDEEH